MLKKLAKTTLATTSILAGAALSTASPSHADIGVSKLKGYTPSEITKVGVNASGTAYIQTGLMGIAASLQVIVDAEVSGRVKSWNTWLRVKTENSSWVHFSNHSASKSYSIPRPKKVNTVTSIAVPHMTLAPVMVIYCNAMADKLRAQGKSNQEIFSQDRTVPVAIRTDLSYETSGIDGLHQADGSKFDDWQKINLICKGRVPTPPVQTAGAFKPPPVNFKINDIKLFLTTFSGANTQPNAATTCKKGQLKVRLKASKAGPAKFKLWTKVDAGPMTSKVIDAWASFDGNGSFKAEYTEWVSVNKTTFMQAKAEEMVTEGPFGKSTPWEDITLPCMDIGGGGLSVGNPHPADDGMLPPRKLTGDFSFIDTGSPRCERTGKALINFKTTGPAPQGNVHWSLDCTNGTHLSGVAQAIKNPKGGYIAPALASFPITKTSVYSCALKSIAPKAKTHQWKSHTFKCVTPNVETGANGIQVAPKPNTGATRVPATLVPNRLDKAKAEAVKRRREAAKKAAEAKRKREAAAKRVAEAKKKAEAKRKRDAAIKAAAALRLRKLKALKAAAVKRAAAAALARRKAAAASVTKRKATLRKRTAQSITSTSTTARGRVIRRR